MNLNNKCQTEINFIDRYQNKKIKIKTGSYNINQFFSFSLSKSLYKEISKFLFFQKFTLVLRLFSFINLVFLRYLV